MSGIQITPKSNPRNADGQFKTIDQLMRQQLTVLQYGSYLASKEPDPLDNTPGYREWTRE